ncbi:hypothetical protein AOLI_G00161020 [Acnodon oligacanthus]
MEQRVADADAFFGRRGTCARSVGRALEQSRVLSFSVFYQARNRRLDCSKVTCHLAPHNHTERRAAPAAATRGQQRPPHRHKQGALNHNEKRRRRKKQKTRLILGGGLRLMGTTDGERRRGKETVKEKRCAEESAVGERGKGIMGETCQRSETASLKNTENTASLHLI